METLPSNLKETVKYIDDLIIPNMNLYLKNYTEHNFVIDSHFGLGMYIRNHFELWQEKSELRKWFHYNYFLDHPDDISSIILRYYYRVKNNNDINISDAVNELYKYWIKNDNQLKNEK